MAMPSVGAYINCDRLDWIETHFKACKAIGARNIRIGPGGYDPAKGTYAEQVKVTRARYRKVAKLAKNYGVRAVIETHMGQLGPTIHKALALVDGMDPKHVGIMWDPGNQVMEGGETYRMAIDIAGPYLAEVHAKNMSWAPADEKDGRTVWKCVSSPVHKGIVDWPAVIHVLKEKKYDGWLFFEDFSTEEPMEARITRNLKWFRELIGG